MTTQLPEGWTVRQTRFMWCLVDPDGKDRSFGLTKEVVENAIHLQPEFYQGGETVRDPGSYKL
jgi:hypothetical protein